MKYNAIELAFKSALTNSDLKVEDKNLIFKAYDELLETKHQFRLADLEYVNLSLITPYDLTNLLNSATYTQFGAVIKDMQKSAKDDTYRPDVYCIARKYHQSLIDNGEFESITYNHCLNAADFLTDLWFDNEEYGNNMPNGDCRTIEGELLRTIVNKHMEELKTNLGEMDYRSYCERMELPEWQVKWLLNSLGVKGGEN